jgi:hypothetical protein
MTVEVETIGAVLLSDGNWYEVQDKKVAEGEKWISTFELDSFGFISPEFDAPTGPGFRFTVLGSDRVISGPLSAVHAIELRKASRTGS